MREGKKTVERLMRVKGQEVFTLFGYILSGAAGRHLLSNWESTPANEGKRVSRLQGRNVGQRAVGKEEYYGIAKYLDLTIQFIQSPLNMTPSMVKHDNLTLQVQSRQPRQRRNVGMLSMETNTRNA